MNEFKFRVTGPQSVERLEPIVRRLIPGAQAVSTSADPDAGYGKGGDGSDLGADKKLDLVWETTCQQTWRERHNGALVLNKLHNVTVLEDKANLAFLEVKLRQQQKEAGVAEGSKERDSVDTLQTFIASSLSEIEAWAADRWGFKDDEEFGNEEDWWVLKASGGNGGKDVYVLSQHTYASVLHNLPSINPAASTSDNPKNDDWVLQKYVSSPMLYKELGGAKKFHFRCYSLLRADMSAYVYQMAYVLTAGHDYTNNTNNTNKQDEDNDIMSLNRVITNLSVNKHLPGYPGQIPCDVKSEYPDVYKKLTKLWAAYITAAAPFMSNQRSPLHFDFFGIDVMANERGQVFLLEANRLPGLESSDLNKEAEDKMYDEMMAELLAVVLAPLADKKDPSLSSLSEMSTERWACVRQPSVEPLAKYRPKSGPGSAKSAGEPNPEQSLPLNLLAWRMFTKKEENRTQVFLSEGANTADTVEVGNDEEETQRLQNVISTLEKQLGTLGGDMGDIGQIVPKVDESKSRCALPGCTYEGIKMAGKCSRCKSAEYCTAAHQKEHWTQHKGVCKKLAKLAMSMSGGGAGSPSSNNMSSMSGSSIDMSASDFEMNERQAATDSIFDLHNLGNGNGNASGNGNDNKGTLPTDWPQSAKAKAKEKADASSSESNPESRISRCMFCGDEVTMETEADGVEHMRVCSALQEQLNSKDQFTIPKVLREKGINLDNVKEAPTL